MIKVILFYNLYYLHYAEYRRHIMVKSPVGVFSMHISEGILSVPVLVGGGVFTAAATAIGLKRLDIDRIMHTAMLTATFFVASLIHVPIGPGSVHLVLNGLLGIVLGWVSFPAILIGLLLQAVFFQFGGFLVLGVNAFNMAAPAVLCHYLCRPFIQSARSRAIAGFAGGALAVLLAALLMALSLALSDTGFFATAQIVVAANLPIMVIEGIVTMFAVGFITKIQPDILSSHLP